MVMAKYNENNYEQTIIGLFREKLGYEYVYGPTIERDYTEPYWREILEYKVRDLNRQAHPAAIEEALRKVEHIDGASLVERNEIFTHYLQDGVEVSYHTGTEIKADLIRLVDWNTIAENNFTIVNQWSYKEKETKRADIVVFLNGLPVVLMELKSPSREETDVSAAYRQLRNYMKEITDLFTYNAFCVMTDMTETKAGTITASEDRFMQWKSKDGQYLSQEVVDYDVLFEGMFRKDRLLDILRNFICFSKNEGGTAKILAGYHQYYAVNKAVQRTLQAVRNDGRIGTFWHTQGSGKSLSMVFYSHLLQKYLDHPTIVVITDRNDLDDQLYTQFANCKDFLRQTPQHAESREDLKGKLSNAKANGIYFTTMQKFEEGDEPLSQRKDIIVMTDEAHRGQYGFEEKINLRTGHASIGMARVIRGSLPHASFIGFTGTPIALKDKNTIDVFGDIIDSYDMTQSVLDHSTVPVYYESRVVNLKLDDQVLKQLDDEYDLLEAEGATKEQVEKSKREMSHLEEILGADTTIDALVKDIIYHYERYRESELTGKALVVAYSRPIAIKIYRRMLELRPAWKNKVKCVMTESNNDPEGWHEIIGNKQYKKELAKKFKDNSDPLKIAIVVDMWLTGFDVPSLGTMYIFKPMSGHNLMQAIARVNRVFKGKAGGLVVDYIGIAQALKEAMKFYTSNDRKNFGDPDIKKRALEKWQEYLEVCRNLMHGYDYRHFSTATDVERGEIIKGAVNFLMAVKPEEVMEQKRKDYIQNSFYLHQYYQLCKSLLADEQHWETAFFETVRIMAVRLTSKGSTVSKAEIDRRIRELLKQSVQSEGVISLFHDDKKEFSLSDPAFLDELRKMKQKNLAAKLLEDLIRKRIHAVQRTNLVMSKKFSDLMNLSLSRYLKGMLTNEEVIEELLKLAQQINASEQQGNDLGLTNDEKAFYDALTQPQAVKDLYTNDQLIGMTRELTEQLRKNRTIDWNKKETARAKMRVMVKHLLKKYHYPPEEQQNALDTVIKQCELWSETQVTSPSYNLSAPYEFEENNYLMAAEDRI